MTEELKTIETVDTSPFKRMVMTIGELPTSFVDSMTYYELLAWLCNYLQNTVIPTVNNNAEAVEELQGLFIELKTFVDEYFDNLDVQEEINNKLDAMAEAGTLQEIITSYIQANVAWTFDTVADMKLSENLIAGSYAQTLGFRSLDDGGGATYYITDSGTANEMDVIAVGDSLYAKLVTPTVIFPEMLGAYGDGIHNDYDAINRALYLGDVKGKKSYKVGSELALNGRNINIHKFVDEVTISNNSDGDKPVKVEIDLASTLILQNFKNSDFYIGKVSTLNITATTSSNAFAYNSIHGGQIGSLYIYGNSTNAWVNENMFEDIRITSVLSIVGSGYPHNHNKFINVVCEDGTTITVTKSYCNYFSFRGETVPTFDISDDNRTFGNVFELDWYSSEGDYWSITNYAEKILKNNIFRRSDYMYMNDYTMYQAEVDNSTYTISLPQYTTLKSFIVDVANGGSIRIQSDSPTFRIKVTPLDSSNQPYDTNPNAIFSSNLPWNNSDKRYQQTTNQGYCGFTINSKSTASKLLVQIYNYATGTASYVNATYSGVRPKYSEVAS